MKTDKENLAPAITLYTKHFNRMCLWVSTEILKGKTVQKRVSIISKFFEIARHCEDLNNYTALYEIYSGVDFILYRCKLTKEYFEKKKISLKAQFDYYRGLFNLEDKYLLHRKKVSLASPPCLPYLGIYLADVTAILSGRTEDDKINGMINFRKRRLVAKVIREILKFQKTTYCLLTVTQVRDFLLDAPVWDNQTLDQYIHFREPKSKTDESQPVTEETFLTSILRENYPPELQEVKPNSTKYAIKKTKKLSFKNLRTKSLSIETAHILSNKDK